MISAPGYIKKYLKMKPEVSQIFADLESFKDFVRMQNPAVKYDEADLYRNSSPIWQKYLRHQKSIARRNAPK